MKKTACYEIINKQNQILPEVLIEYILEILPDRNNSTNSKFKIIMDGLNEKTISKILNTEKFLDINLSNIRILIDSFSGLKIDTSQYIINILTTMNKRKALDVLISIDYDKKPALKNILNTLDTSLIGFILCTANIEEDLFMKEDKDYQAIGKFFSHINEANKNKILQSFKAKNKPIHDRIKFKIEQHQEIKK